MRSKQIKISSILLIFVIATLLFSCPLRAGKLEEIRGKIEKTKQLLKEEELLHQKERSEAVSARKSLRDRIEVLEEEVTEIEKGTSRLEEEIKKVELSENEIARKKDASLALISDIRELLSSRAKLLQKEVNSDIPYNKEHRLMKMNAFNKKIKGEDADALECSRELYHLFVGEIDLGYTSEIYPDEIETGEAEIRKAKFLRIGRNIFCYRTNDGKKTAKLVKDKTGFEWKKDLCHTCKTNIWKAIQVMEGRRIPHLVDLPIDLGKVEISDKIKKGQ